MALARIQTIVTGTPRKNRLHLNGIRIGSFTTLRSPQQKRSNGS
ncbi:MAG TPA: hypothetical protein VF955_08835 [Pyrinomonadaceae bacterium]